MSNRDDLRERLRYAIWNILPRLLLPKETTSAHFEAWNARFESELRADKTAQEDAEGGSHEQ